VPQLLTALLFRDNRELSAVSCRHVPAPSARPMNPTAQHVRSGWKGQPDNPSHSYVRPGGALPAQRKNTRGSLLFQRRRLGAAVELVLPPLDLPLFPLAELRKDLPLWPHAPPAHVPHAPAPWALCQPGPADDHGREQAGIDRSDAAARRRACGKEHARVHSISRGAGLGPPLKRQASHFCSHSWRSRIFARRCCSILASRSR
jgi:hypothetical protein